MLLGKKYIYVNGTSISEGGGFEPYECRKDVRDAYSVELPSTQLECSYPYFLYKEIKSYQDITLINDAKCGSGIERLVRKSMQWIDENSDKLKETIFIFEPQFGIRLDWYVNDWQDFGVLNAAKNMEGKYPFTLVKRWYYDDDLEQKNWNKNYREIITNYIDNFFDGDVQNQKDCNLLVLFVSYLNQLKLDYFITIPEFTPGNVKKILFDFVPTHKNLVECFETDIWNFAKSNKMLILDEVDNNDNHIGIHGNKKIGNLLFNYISSQRNLTFNKNNIDNKVFKVFSVGKSFDVLHKIQPKFKMFFKYKGIKLEKTLNENECDFCFIDDVDPYVLQFKDGIEIITNQLQKVKEILELKPILKKKNFFITIMQEKITEIQYQTFISKCVEILGISKQQIFLIDALVSNYMNSNNIPLEFKIKAFAFRPTHDEIQFSDRNFKFTYLNGGLDENRLFVLDLILYNYGDVEKLKKENKISVIDTKNFIQLFLGTKHYLKSSKEDFDNLKMPLYVDTDRKDVTFSFDYPDFQNIMKLYIDTIFSVVNDTHSYDKFFYRDNFDDWTIKKTIQFSEKVLMAIYAENLTFAIVDGIYYSEFEKIGFDFSYLKEIFDIDYTTNNHFENFKSVEKFINFVKDKSIDELNEIRFKYKDVIMNNKNNLTNLLYGSDYTNSEKIFLKKLSGKNI